MPLEPIADLDAFRTALGQAIAAGGLTLDAVADAAGLKGGSSISDWRYGRVKKFEPAQVFAVEEALGCDPGELSTHLGYLPLSAAGTVVATILADRSLSSGSRMVLLKLYRELRSEHAGRTERPKDTSEEGDLALKAQTGCTP